MNYQTAYHHTTKWAGIEESGVFAYHQAGSEHTTSLWSGIGGFVEGGLYRPNVVVLCSDGRDSIWYFFR